MSIDYQQIFKQLLLKKLISIAIHSEFNPAFILDFTYSNKILKKLKTDSFLF